MESIFVYGSGGHAKVIIDIIEKEGKYKVGFLLDDDIEKKGASVYGYKIIGGKTELLEARKKYQVTSGIIAIGYNSIRASLVEWCETHSFQLISAIDPSAKISKSAVIGNGSAIMPGVIVNADVKIGKNVILNTKSSVDHDSIIGDNTHIAVGAILCGTVTVGESSLIGAGSIVIPNIVIGKNVIVGAGAVVTKTVLDGRTVIGVPAKVIDEIC